jgi:hypothetical protein
MDNQPVKKSEKIYRQKMKKKTTFFPIIQNVFNFMVVDVQIKWKAVKWINPQINMSVCLWERFESAGMEKDKQ